MEQVGSGVRFRPEEKWSGLESFLLFLLQGKWGIMIKHRIPFDKKCFQAGFACLGI
jgi:hypothetical protein